MFFWQTSLFISRQWLPRTKLETLVGDSERDQSKLCESRKPAERKAVRKAYQEAMLYRRQVTGQLEREMMAAAAAAISSGNQSSADDDWACNFRSFQTVTLMLRWEFGCLVFSFVFIEELKWCKIINKIWVSFTLNYH